ncbi:hypothetical protein CIHG_09461 [Coccidioides immitis H538.4]|uniref:Uncharacterized protein n=2 Tax=Coccidioides immitis TaxID=5501 RepID=A0A0J8S456_COCIT|nr:hypothetical protein CIRG_06497 [Coccidioides immitis RMSCC 2394]KMU91606.1 hypothetical protein CIHG_09461 [Coccidioides immitis H538.4]
MVSEVLSHHSTATNGSTVAPMQHRNNALGGFIVFRIQLNFSLPIEGSLIIQLRKRKRRRICSLHGYNDSWIKFPVGSEWNIHHARDDDATVDYILQHMAQNNPSRPRNGPGDL